MKNRLIMETPIGRSEGKGKEKRQQLADKIRTYRRTDLYPGKQPVSQQTYDEDEKKLPLQEQERVFTGI